MAISFKSLGATPAKYQRTAIITSTQAWTVPADVTQLEILMAGGGGGGGGGGYIGTAMGGGGSVVDTVISVMPNTSYWITIGGGGAGGTYFGADGRGSDGGSSSFGALLTVPGGKAGRAVANQTHALEVYGIGLGSAGGRIVQNSNYTPPTSMPDQPLSYKGLGAGGGGGSAISGTYMYTPAVGLHGSGRGGLVDNAGGNAVANTGAGGGGSGNAVGGWAGCNGGNGGSGICIIKYWSAL